MKFKYNITGLDCPNCAAKLAASMERCEGVESVKINYLTERLTVESSLSEDALLSHLTSCAKAFDSSVKIEK
ncbi:MAG: heavy-metal-associated domain-containing protein [Clostridia bacterium]|nr:heavy-metal-associated domain-containing protein [Clostridia bacterium]